MIQEYKDEQSNILIVFSSFNLVYTDSSPPNCCQFFVFLNSIVKFSKLTLGFLIFWDNRMEVVFWAFRLILQKDNVGMVLVDLMKHNYILIGGNSKIAVR